MHLNPKKIEIVSFDDIVNATVLSVSTATIATTFENDIKSSSGFQHKNINRTRKKVEIIFKDVLPRFTRKAYRMREASFVKLVDFVSKYTYVCRIRYRILPTYMHIHFIYDVSSPFGQSCLIYKFLYYLLVYRS